MTGVLLLHPLGADRRCWSGVPLGETVAVDLPGHGAAPRLPLGAGIAEFTDVVAGALDERVHVVGVSLGGLVAQDLAARHPELVDRLVLVDTVATYPEPMRQMWRDRAATARSGGLAELADPMAAMWFTEPFLTGGDPTPALIRERFLAMDPEGYARACEALETADTTAAVPAIEAPTLVACGSADLPHFTESARWLHERIPDADLTWLDGAHAVFLERPAEFTAEVRRFLGSMA